VEREIPEPGARHVRIKVEACGICHTDSFIKDRLFPGTQYPVVPGHEIAGVIDAIGKDVIEFHHLYHLPEQMLVLSNSLIPYQVGFAIFVDS